MDNQKHKMYLTQILMDIYSDRELSVVLGFKGGTAAMLFYNLPRFSVDLDFNLLDKTYAEKAYQKVRKIILKYGKIHDEQKFFGDLLSLDYESGERNLKIDISHREENYDEYVIKNLLGINIKTMEISDMFSHKLVALLGRKEFAERDIFDCWYFMKEKTPVNRQIVETLTQKPLSDYLQDCINQMETVPKRSLLFGLGELLADDMKTFVRKKLQQETALLLKMYQQFPIVK
ncbi:MAG: nucleotidyl transferase AbiEii/AbiGii toxin family protein [Dysgonamonadaceae bacterium]|jgi:predicted nucleotidyltransferase component of viral defense system|nr:nucleotidyl transferase AbiEii/AbiGii toxin family protein [Dysgonamonadaceae bacterium]